MALIAFFAISIIFSFLCSIWEAVLLSIPPSSVQIKLDEGSAVGLKLKEFKDNIDRPLAAILTLNTIAHTVGAIGVGATATSMWPDNEIMTAAVVPVLMTLAILILSELIPKTLGANYWQQLTNFTVRSLDIVIKILFPLVWLGQIITKSLKKDKNRSVLSRADFRAMADLGEQEGIFKDGESMIIKNLLRFKDITAENIMTPRTVVKAAPETTTIRDFYEANKNLTFSRIPIYHESKDNIKAYVLKDEVLEYLIEHDDGNVKTLLDVKRDITIVSKKIPITHLFKNMMEKREHIALVVDQFGGMAGIVTMEDIFETLLGTEILDESDHTADMQDLARQKWAQKAKDLDILENKS